MACAVYVHCQKIRKIFSQIKSEEFLDLDTSNQSFSQSCLYNPRLLISQLATVFQKKVSFFIYVIQMNSSS